MFFCPYLFLIFVLIPTIFTDNYVQYWNVYTQNRLCVVSARTIRFHTSPCGIGRNRRIWHNRVGGGVSKGEYFVSWGPAFMMLEIPRFSWYQQSLCCDRYFRKKRILNTGTSISFSDFCLSSFPHVFWDQKMWPKAIVLYSIVQFVDVESKREKQIFCFYHSCSPRQKPCKSHILLRDPEYAFCLDRSIDPQQNPFLRRDISFTFPAVFIKLWRTCILLLYFPL